MNPEPSRARRRSLLAIGLALAACLLVGWLVYRAFLAVYLDGERRAAAQRLDFYAVSLEATLARYESLPWLLALERDLGALLDHPAERARQAAANRYLETAQGDAGVAAAYLIDAGGLTLAASNWQRPNTFVGQNYAFRPYFRAAAAGQLGRFYGVGVTTGEPGYFLAAPVRQRGVIGGAVAIKVGLEAFEEALTRSGERVLLADADGVVFLASQPAWRYRTLAPLAEVTRRRLAETRQYGPYPLLPLVDGVDLLDGDEAARRALPASEPLRLLAQAKSVGHLGWRVILLASPSEAQRGALGAGVAAGFAAAFALALAVYLRLRRRRRAELQAADRALRRAHADLEQRIAERTADLTEKVGALERTEAILRETRNDAVQAGKRAVLGQMAAGMNHELNQPLAALNTLSDNAVALLDLGRLDEARENLTLISQMIERTGRIVQQLKSFARKGPLERGPVPVHGAVEHALLIVEPRRREIGAEIRVLPMADGLCVQADAVRLEQVLVNLLRNGLDAMAGQPAPLLVIAATPLPLQEGQPAQVRIAIRDHGPGLPPAVLAHLFEPFFTTKPVGEGLGLGLAISLTIVESFGGRLEAANGDGGGAEFAIIVDAIA